ncbi:TetR/AcrR family transcriptional regulator [Streptomyces sp. NPDC001822]|uniref:TetR/AcrR family transcriptional regulator n=1 Tax=Streptomyces sp. NPDC001822 TaxID=3364614 RepID=UPI0036C8D3DF
MTDLAAGPAVSRRRQIVTAARALLEAEGQEALTMRRVADRVGVRASALYKHFPDKSSLLTVLAGEMLREVAGVLAAAERAVPGSFAALATAYRAYALAHPHLYLVTMGRALPPAAAADAAEAPLFRTAGGDEDTARAAWAFAHGMVVLELGGRFPPGADVPAVWEAGIAAFAGHAAG